VQDSGVHAFDRRVERPPPDEVLVTMGTLEASAGEHSNEHSA
jgi:hypothetical protein